MELIFKPLAVEDIAYFKKTGNKVVQKKIETLLKEIKTSPYSGTGKVEQLKHGLSGYWSRRINREHRIVYKVIEKDELVEIYSLKGHY